MIWDKKRPQWRTVNQATEENCNRMTFAAAEEDCLSTRRTVTEHQHQRHAPAAIHQGQKRWVSSWYDPSSRVRL